MRGAQEDSKGPDNVRVPAVVFYSFREEIFSWVDCVLSAARVQRSGKAAGYGIFVVFAASSVSGTLCLWEPCLC